MQTALATYNTINKWAAGTADNYVLTQLAELTGLGARIVVLSFVNQGLAANSVFARSGGSLGLTLADSSVRTVQPRSVGTGPAADG